MDYVAKNGPEGWKHGHGERGKEEEPVPEPAAPAVLPAKNGRKRLGKADFEEI